MTVLLPVDPVSVSYVEVSRAVGVARRHLGAALAWCDWEDAVIAAGADDKAPALRASDSFQLAFARIVTHYWSHGAWLEESALVKNANLLSNTPGVLIHGLLDLGCPLVIPYRLAEAWPGCKLRVVEGAGHDARHPGLSEAAVAVLNGFAIR